MCFILADEKLEISSEAISKLVTFRAQPKYMPLRARLYSGLKPEAARLQAEAQMNDLASRLIAQLPLDASKAMVLMEFRRTLMEFSGGDTDDREQICVHLEEIMDIVGMQSSNGLLNSWM